MPIWHDRAIFRERTLGHSYTCFTYQKQCVYTSITRHMGNGHDSAVMSLAVSTLVSLNLGLTIHRVSTKTSPTFLAITRERID